MTNDTGSRDERGDIQLLLHAYANGYFPMAESRDAKELHWFYPEKRGVIPLDGFHIPASLAKFLKKSPFTYSADRAFRDVITACAERDSTWINGTIIELYCQLHERGFAHSIEVWKEKQLAGGLYGVALGGAFFGESMFSRQTNASKAALVELVRRLKAGGYQLLDAQYVNDHLKQFGIIEISRAEYLDKLKSTLSAQPNNIFR